MVKRKIINARNQMQKVISSKLIKEINKLKRELQMEENIKYGRKAKTISFVYASDFVDVAENISGVPASSVAQAQQLEQDYNALAIPYDLFFLALWIGAFVTTLTSTIQSNKTGVFSFFGFLFVGSLILLLLTAYVSDFASWFMANVFDTLFATSAISTPILDYYLNNLGFLNFIWWLILVLVAFIDRGIISKSGSVEE